MSLNKASTHDSHKNVIGNIGNQPKFSEHHNFKYYLMVLIWVLDYLESFSLITNEMPDKLLLTTQCSHIALNAGKLRAWPMTDTS